MSDEIFDTLDAGEVAAGLVSLSPSAPLANGLYRARARLQRGGRIGPWSATLAFAIIGSSEPGTLIAGM